MATLALTPRKKGTGNAHSKVWSSGVAFQPSKWQGKYWRIGNRYYDLTEFAPRHPGGEDLILMARNRFDDCTYAFEAHHTNQPLVRRMLKKYEVVGLIPPQPSNRYQQFPNLLLPDAFFSVLRARANAYLRGVGGPGPTRECLYLFWALLCTWFSLFALNLLLGGSVGVTIMNGIVGGLLGGYGHNWCHQPMYRNHALVLDLSGMSSLGWVREHLLQHHMFTNTPLDNHFTGTEPFLCTDPTTRRSWFQAIVAPMINPVLLFFGPWVNYIAHGIELALGNEKFSIGKLFLPTEIVLMVWACGAVRGTLLQMLQIGIVGTWYYTIALLNHNTEHCWDLKIKNKTSDWGVAQLQSSSDIEVGLDFLSSAKYLWLNFHTVHHLFPHTDMSKHPGLQRVLLETLKDFPAVRYDVRDFWPMYREMLTSFSTASHLGEEINLYPGNRRVG